MSAVKRKLASARRWAYAGKPTTKPTVMPMPGFRLPMVSLAFSLAVLPGASPPARADTLLLQQAVPADQAGTAFLLIDRARLVLVRARKEKGLEHTLEVTLTGEPAPVTVSLRCVDQAATRQVLDALRTPGLPLLDVTARCRL
jgi:hypothetical protein